MSQSEDGMPAGSGAAPSAMDNCEDDLAPSGGAGQTLVDPTSFDQQLNRATMMMVASGGSNAYTVALRQEDYTGFFALASTLHGGAPHTPSPPAIHAVP